MTSRRPGTDLTAPLADPAFYADDPFPRYAALREEAPVAWCDDPGFWALTRHADVLAVSKDHARFCSGRGILQRDIGRELPETPAALLYADPPEHTRYRQLVQPAFAPSVIRALEAGIAERTRVLLDAWPASGTVDVVPTLAVPLPLLVIADLLGVPEGDLAALEAWTDALIRLATDENEADLVAATEMAGYFLTIIEERLERPRDDLISTLAHVQVDGARLTSDELMMFCGQLLVAGNETTRNLISAGLVALANAPEQWQRLVEDRSLVTSAVEELLRWTAPVISFLRTATDDVVIGDQPIARGEHVLLLYGAANRDPAVFGPSAEQLDVGRHPNPHLAFGFGAHFCIGAALARLEARIVLEALVDRYASLEPAGGVERLESTVIAGVTAAPLAWHG